MARFYIDTEFHEDGYEKPIRLISIGIVSDDGREFYAECDDIDHRSLSDWLQQNVVPYLKGPRLPRSEIASQILGFIGSRECFECKGTGMMEVRPLGLRRCEVCEGGARLVGIDAKIEFWGYFSSYDWVAFCQLFGSMVTMPPGMPHMCHDLKQLANHLGISRNSFPEQVGNKHNALDDARWNLRLHQHLEGWMQPGRDGA